MTFLRSRIPGAATISTAVLCALAGCSGATANTSRTALEQANITVGVFPTVDSAGLFIAQMNGYFAQRGLHVTFKDEPTSQDAVNDQIAGKVDISSADYVTYIDNELDGKASLRIIAGASLMQAGELQLLVPGKSRIRTIRELAGKSIGVAAPGDIATLLVDELLVENGVSPGQVTFVPGTDLPDAPSDLSRGEFDAAPVPEPYVTDGEEAYGVQELADMDQGATENFPLQGYAVTSVWARENPGTLDAFVQALIQGQELADTDRTAVEKAAETYLDVKPETAALISLPDYPLSVTASELDRVEQAMANFGLLPKDGRRFSASAMLG
jgi:NitT/TauT family transport system substrate-binding protein